MQGMRLVVAMLTMAFALGCGIAFAAAEENDSDPSGTALLAAPDPEPGIELKAERTATSETYRLPSGALETRIYESPIHYRDGEGDWRPIEEGFAPTSDGGLTNGANEFDLELPERLGEDPLRLAVNGEWVSAELLGQESEAVEAEGNEVSYESADGDTTFDLSSFASGIKEDIVIADASRSSFSFDLQASDGLTPDVEENGSITFRDPDGRGVIVLPPPMMHDSAVGQPAISHAVHYRLEPLEAGGWRLTIEADRAWLEAAERTFPVTIDPTIATYSPSLDCSIEYSEYSAGNGRGMCASGGEPWLYAMFYPGQYDIWYRSLLRFNLSAIPTSAEVTSATIGIHTPWAVNNTSGLELRRVTKNWTSALDWKRYAGAGFDWTTPGGDYTSEGAQILTSQRGGQAGWWNFSNGLTPVVQQWVSSPSTNNGALLKLLDDHIRECEDGPEGTKGCKERVAGWFESSAAADSAARPYMKVEYFPKAPSSSNVVSPTEGTRSARHFKLRAKWSEAGVTGITFQYKAANTSGFKTIPTANVIDTTGQSVTWPVALSGVKESEPLFFDTKGLVAEPGDIEIRALFEGSPGVTGYSAPAKAKLEPDMGGPRDATAPIGPGSVNLLTGNFTVTRTDVSIPGVTSGLEFARSHNSRQPGFLTDTSVLGRGWKPATAVEEAGGAEWRSVREVIPSAEEQEEGLVPYALLTDLEGYEYAFEKSGETFITPPEAAGWVLVRQSASTISLADPSGNRTLFESTAGGTEYLPVSISMTGGSTNSTTMVYQLIEGKRRLHMMIAASAPGLSCTESSASTTVGCRALVFSYKPATTWGAPAFCKDRLSSITYYGPASATTNGSWEVARYDYDAAGRLIAVWDPRISPNLKETYAYLGGAASYQGGMLKTITPPAEEPWTLDYVTANVDYKIEAGRLKAAKRPSLLASPTVAQTTVAYNVPLSGSGAPYDLSPSTVAQWGQADQPVYAAAIFPPDQIPAEPPSSYSRATLYYTDAEGQLVNTATPAGAGTTGASITTSETDEHGNVVRELTAQNRLRALAAGSESAKRSHELETKRLFSADGTEMQEEWGPLHEVRLEAGGTAEARMHTTIEYDQGWPGTGVKPHLPTRQTTEAIVQGQGGEADQRITETQYDWALRKPTKTIVDPNGLNLHTRIAYDAVTGLPTERSLPAKPEGGDAHTTKTSYYTVGGNAFDPCAKRPAYAGMPCKIQPAKQPGTPGQPELLETTYASYNALGQPLVINESPGGKPSNVRATTITYDSAGRATERKQTGGGVALPPTRTVYNPTTGRAVEQKLVCQLQCEGFDDQALVTNYDTLGRPTGYLDGDGNLSTATYDLLGQPLTTTDGKGAQTRSYDPTTGMLIGLEDSAAGTFTASYDADGNLREQGLPNGLVATTTYDEAGAATDLTYTKVTGCSTNCTWLEFSAERSIQGQVLAQSSTLSSQQYTYDNAGRLELVEDTLAGGSCTTRSYSYDADSNRTALVTRAPGIGGACDTNSQGTPQTYSYDDGDRLIAEGISYDNHGRTTSLPAAYAGGSTLTTSYFTNDMVASQSQGGITNTYQLDSAMRPRQVTQSGAKTGTEIFHYAGSSDAPAWIDRGSSWTRNISGPGGLGAIQDSVTGTSLQLTNLHGDVVATASLSPTATGPTATFEFDEFGNPKQSGSPRFGWLGGKQRRTELPSGVIQMGVRSYVPAMGRFISMDPMLGGSANAYDYANADPVNTFDLTGTCVRQKCNARKAREREQKRLARLFSRTRHQVSVISRRLPDSKEDLAVRRIQAVIQSAFTRAEPQFSKHPSWGNACHTKYNESLARDREALEYAFAYEHALDACAFAVGKVWQVENKKQMR